MLQILEQKTYCERRMYQLKKVQQLLAYAYEHTRYYRNLFDKNNIKPWDVQSLDDMKKIPVLTKDIVRDNLQDMISDVIPKDKLIYVTTGGSTGKPLGFYISQWLANFLLEPLDYMVTGEKHRYVRYVDDIVIFGSNKKTVINIAGKNTVLYREELQTKNEEKLPDMQI